MLYENLNVKEIASQLPLKISAKIKFSIGFVAQLLCTFSMKQIFIKAMI